MKTKDLWKRGLVLAGVLLFTFSSAPVSAGDFDDFSTEEVFVSDDLFGEEVGDALEEEAKEDIQKDDMTADVLEDQDTEEIIDPIQELTVASEEIEPGDNTSEEEMDEITGAEFQGSDFYEEEIPLLGEDSELEDQQAMLVTDSSGITYEVSNGGAVIKGYTGISSVLSIPEKINGYVVWKIESDAFKDNTTLTSVTIPSTIDTIGNQAFANCTSLTSVTINAENLADLSSSAHDYRGYSVFYNAGSRSGLTVTFGQGVTRIPANLFATPSSEGDGVFCRISRVTIPSSVTEIGSYAFYRCYALSAVNMANGPESIGSNAFAYDTKLTTLSLSSKLKSIGEYAFQGSGLQSITIPTAVTSIGNCTFSDCTNLENVTFNAANVSDLSSSSHNYKGYSVFYNSGSRNGFTVTFGEGVTRIPANLFATPSSEGDGIYCRISKVTIPSSVKTIGSYAFFRCYALATVDMADGVETIDSNAFAYDTRLTGLSLSNKLKSIGDSAFLGCALQKITVPASVTSFGNTVFMDCTKLTSMRINATNLADVSYNSSRWSGYAVLYNAGSYDGFSVTFGSGATRIPAYLFATPYDEGNGVYCRISEVKIPSTVKTVGQTAFYNCYALKSVYYEGSATAWNSISIGSDNEYLNNAQHYYNSSIPADEVRAGWGQDSTGYYYINADGSRVRDSWKLINGSWYHFNSNGYMQTNWLKLGNIYYYLGTDGKMRTGWQKVGSYWYYLDSSGKMLSSQWISNTYYVKSSGAMAVSEWVDGEKYYVDANGKWVQGKTKHTEGWKKDTKGWWFQYADGTYPANRWAKIGSVWYHFNQSGYMQTGWLSLSGTYYYLGTNGKMCTGWQKIGTYWYYMDSSGKMLKNCWISSTYYLKSSGAMAVNEWVDNGKYYVDGNGKYVPGKTKATAHWIYTNSGSRYVNEDGSYSTNKWQKIGSDWYHFNTSGYMQTGWISVNGTWYFLESSGKMAYSKWINGEYYVKSNGAMAKNEWIGNYHVGADGKWDATKGKR